MRYEILAKWSGKFRVYECCINPSWKEIGLANILLAREKPDGSIIFAAYLVDIFCLGLKNTFWNPNISKKTYEEALEPSIYKEEPIECDISLARQIIYGAIEYASKMGFKPHKNFRITKYILGRKKDETKTKIEFGKNGRPFYISGSNDNVEEILAKLRKNVGEGNFDYLIRR